MERGMQKVKCKMKKMWNDDNWSTGETTWLQLLCSLLQAVASCRQCRRCQVAIMLLCRQQRYRCCATVLTMSWCHRRGRPLVTMSTSVMALWWRHCTTRPVVVPKTTWLLCAVVVVMLTTSKCRQGPRHRADVMRTACRRLVNAVVLTTTWSFSYLVFNSVLLL